ncbi:MAG TPA: hypothetical protein VGO93_08855, partial [Candidatus Xenobia bacterium]
MSLLAFPPLQAVAQGQPELSLTVSGNVDKWNPQTKKWEHYDGGIAHQGDTYRAIEGGSLTGQVTGTQESFKLHSCSAIRFIRLHLSPSHNDMYCKVFGQLETKVPTDRTAIDDLIFECPVGLQQTGMQGGGPGLHTTLQTPTAREVRLGIDSGSGSRMKPVSFIAGTITAVDPPAGTFTLRGDNGQIVTVVVRDWSQLAKPTLGQRIMNETPAQMVAELKVGEKLIVYGVATLPGGGSGAFAQATPINFYANVLFPPNGRYIFGATFVLASPITPEIGQGTSALGASTLTLEAGEVPVNTLAGIQLKNVVCEIGAEAFVVPPPPPPYVVGGAGTIGTLPIYVLIGAGVGILIFNNHGS